MLWRNYKFPHADSIRIFTLIRTAYLYSAIHAEIAKKVGPVFSTSLRCLSMLDITIISHPILFVMNGHFLVRIIPVIREIGRFMALDGAI